MWEKHNDRAGLGVYILLHYHFDDSIIIMYLAFHFIFTDVELVTDTSNTSICHGIRYTFDNK